MDPIEEEDLSSRPGMMSLGNGGFETEMKKINWLPAKN